MFRDAAAIDRQATNARIGTLMRRYEASAETFFDGTPDSLDRRLALCDQLLSRTRQAAVRHNFDGTYLETVAALEDDRQSLVELRHALLNGASDRELDFAPGRRTANVKTADVPGLTAEGDTGGGDPGPMLFGRPTSEWAVNSSDPAEMADLNGLSQNLQQAQGFAFSGPSSIKPGGTAAPMQAMGLPGTTGTFAGGGKEPTSPPVIDDPAPNPPGMMGGGGYFDRASSRLAWVQRLAQDPAEDRRRRDEYQQQAYPSDVDTGQMFGGGGDFGSSQQDTQDAVDAYTGVGRGDYTPGKAAPAPAPGPGSPAPSIFGPNIGGGTDGAPTPAAPVNNTQTQGPGTAGTGGDSGGVGAGADDTAGATTTGDAGGGGWTANDYAENQLRPGIGPDNKYTIQSGDTLAEIAQGFGIEDYGDIQRANADVITDPDVIRAGDTINIPWQGETAPGMPPVPGAGLEQNAQGAWVNSGADAVTQATPGAAGAPSTQGGADAVSRAAPAGPPPADTQLVTGPAAAAPSMDAAAGAVQNAAQAAGAPPTMDAAAGALQDAAQVVGQRPTAALRQAARAFLDDNIDCVDYAPELRYRAERHARNQTFALSPRQSDAITAAFVGQVEGLARRVPRRTAARQSTTVRDFDDGLLFD